VNGDAVLYYILKHNYAKASKCLILGIPLLFKKNCFTVSAGQNKQHAGDKNTAMLDRETEELHHQTVGLDVGRLIQQGRQAKGLTQKDLATVCLISTKSHITCIKKIVGLFL